MTIVQFPTKITALRQQLRRNGFHPLPTYGGQQLAEDLPTRTPDMPDWFEIDDENIRYWEQYDHRATATAVAAKFTPALFIRCNIEAAAEAAEKVVREYFEKRGDICVCLPWPTQRLILMRTNEPLAKSSQTFFSPNDDEHQLEIFGDGQMYSIDGQVEKLLTIQHQNLPSIQHSDTEQLVDTIGTLWVEQFGFVRDNPTTRLQWIFNNVRKAEARLAAYKGPDENTLPPDTLAAIKDPSKDGRGTRFWNILRVLKDRGFTSNQIIALLERHPTGIAAGYRGGLRHEVQRAFDKIRIDPTTGEPQQSPEVKQPRGMDALRTLAFNPIKYVVPGVIVEGLTVLAGKPKIGKSWLMYHAAIAVARGGFTLGDIHCIEGDVLYCALEDNQRRLKSRGEKLLGTAGAWPNRMQYFCLGEIPRLNEGGLDMLKNWIKSVSNPRLIVIDTFVAVRAPKKGNQPNFDADYESGKELQKLANEHGIAIVIICHLRKADSDDPFDTVNATLGLNAIVDSIVILKREANTGFSLLGHGRDLPEIEKAIEFNKEACTWRITGDAADIRHTKERNTVLNALEEAGEPVGPKTIAEATGMKSGNVRRLLSKLLREKLVEKARYGKYRIKNIEENAPWE